MKNETEFGYRVRQVLNQGTDRLDSRLATRLHVSRQAALERQTQVVTNLGLAGFGELVQEYFVGYVRVLLTLIALSIGVIGTYYWNSFEQANEAEEIDSALLADELPPSIYLDSGFHHWIEKDSQPSSP